jgi:hypothetical protein
MLPAERTYARNEIRKLYHFVRKADEQVVAAVNTDPKSTWTAGVNGR